MAKGHRSQIKRERNENQKDTRPSAKLSYARVSVQKACYVLDAIRGKDVETAIGILTYNPRYASSIILKLLQSAVANAENNNGMNPADLYIEECFANKGPTMKRIRPRAQGRAYRIEKRMSHITISLNSITLHTFYINVIVARIYIVPFSINFCCTKEMRVIEIRCFS